VSSVGYNPRWDDELTLKVHVPELAVVNFTVYTKDAFVAQYSLPFTSILQGVSLSVSLISQLGIMNYTEGLTFYFGYLFLHFVY